MEPRNPVPRSTAVFAMLIIVLAAGCTLFAQAVEALAQESAAHCAALPIVVGGGSPTPPPTTTPPPDVQWDARLTDLGITLEPAQDCAGGCWRLSAAHFEDEDESGGNHHVFARLYVAGDAPAGLPWHVTWPDGDNRAMTKPLPEWADVPLWGNPCWDFEAGPGPYSAYAGDDPARSDQVVGMGLPQCVHVNYRLTWRWQAGE